VFSGYRAAASSTRLGRRKAALPVFIRTLTLGEVAGARHVDELECALTGLPYAARKAHYCDPRKLSVAELERLTPDVTPRR